MKISQFQKKTVMVFKHTDHRHQHADLNKIVLLCCYFLKRTTSMSGHGSTIGYSEASGSLLVLHVRLALPLGT